jgi:RNA polymerase sigma-70 factor (ECF subfamily)
LNDRRDENLVVASRAGDKSAYALLVKRHYKHVFLVCLGMLGTVHDAEDIAQDVMLKGYVEIGKLRDSKQFGSWIMRIAKNLCINFIHRKNRARKVLAEKATRPNQTTTQNDNLQLAIERLSPETRLPLVMYYFDGESVKTVAEKLNISASGVYQKLQTAIRELHNLLVEQGDVK